MFLMLCPNAFSLLLSTPDSYDPPPLPPRSLVFLKGVPRGWARSHHSRAALLRRSSLDKWTRAWYGRARESARKGSGSDQGPPRPSQDLEYHHLVVVGMDWLAVKS